MIEISMAILVHKKKILIAQRNHAKHMAFMWEFPGGKLEKNETLEECVAREFMEELKLPIQVIEPFMDVVHTYPEKGDFHLHAFWAVTHLDEAPKIMEHEDLKWVSVSELDQFQFCPADLPFVEALKKEQDKIDHLSTLK